MSKPLPILPHMPWNVKQLIVNSANIDTKDSLRAASKNFKDLVSQSHIRYNLLLIGYSDENASVKLRPTSQSEIEQKYMPHEDGYTFENISEDKIVKNGNYIEAGVDQFVKILRNPKVSLDELFVEFEDGYPYNAELLRKVLDRLYTFLSSLTYQIRVKEVQFDFETQNDVLKVLPYLQPGTLKIISIHRHDDLDIIDIDMSEIAETEQWKLAESIQGGNFVLTLPLEKWSHFPDVDVNIPRLDVDKMSAIYNSFLNCGEWWDITGMEMDAQQIVEYFAAFRGRHQKQDGVDKFTIRFPDSGRIVRVSVYWSSVLLEKDPLF